MNNYFIFVKRHRYYDNAVVSKFTIVNTDLCTIVFQADCLENIKTLIPSGELYQVKVTMSPKFKKETPEVLNVPNRSGIRIHTGNYAEDCSGCLLIGNHPYDSPCVYESRNKFNELMPILKQANSICLLIL